MAQSNSVARRYTRCEESIRQSIARHFKLPRSANWTEIAQLAIHEQEIMDWQEEVDRFRAEWDFEAVEERRNWNEYMDQVSYKSIHDFEDRWGRFDEPYPEDSELQYQYSDRSEFDDWWHERPDFFRHFS